MRILVLNPNMSESVTDLLVAAGRQVAAPTTTLVASTAPRGMPYLSTRAESQIGGAIALEETAYNLQDTGEISGAFLAKLGVTYVVVGHSERRQYHAEDDALVAAKAAAALKHGLTPIVCIGEALDIREAGDHVQYNVDSLRGSLAGLTSEQVEKVVVAYEPVWAIGTGRVASAADAQEVCAAIRAELAQIANADVAASVRVLYGGSANAKNVGELVAQEDVDGALVGGASLDGEQFAQMSAIAAGGPLL